MAVKTQVGFRLSLFAKLAKSVEQQPITTPTSQLKTYIQILSTPTGFLRIRNAPGMAGEEIAQVKPGSLYPYLNEDVATGWIEIQYQEPAPGLPNGITGWLSGQFAKKITQAEGEATPSATPK